MSIKHEPTIKRYKQLRQDILAAIANLREFSESLPETTDGLHYGHIGQLEGRARESFLPAVDVSVVPWLNALVEFRHGEQTVHSRWLKTPS